MVVIVARKKLELESTIESKSLWNLSIGHIGCIKLRGAEIMTVVNLMA